MSQKTAPQNKINAPKSKELSLEIEKLIPGGVNSPFRSFHEVGGHTIFVERGEGAYVFDADGNRYIDYVGAWGPAILGHAFEPVARATTDIIKTGPLFGAPHRLELQLAKKIIDGIPSVDMIRFVNSGTEAVMSAIRLARGYTGRDTIIMFEGCYHGHSDSVLGSTTHSHSDGIPESFTKNTVLVPFNNLDALDVCLEKHAGEIAAVIIEPIGGSMSVVAPQPGYLRAVRELCTKFDVVLIFDEVLTGFRVAFGGAQELYDIKPDLTCFGKALGGGMPIGAYGGAKHIMEKLMPLGKVYQAGTFSGNPVTMAGAVAILESLRGAKIYETLEDRSKQLFDGLQLTIKSIDAKRKTQGEKLIPLQLQRVGSMFSITFAPHPVRNFDESKAIDCNLFAIFFHEILKRGIMLPPTAVDACCLSFAHSQEDIDETIKACSDALTYMFL